MDSQSPIQNRITPQSIPLQPINTSKKKPLKLIAFIIGAFAVVYLVFAFITVGMAQEGKDLSITKMFGMEASTFLNALVTGIHMIIMVLALIVFVFVMVALLKMLMAKKDDIEKKKKAKKRLIVSGVALFLILIGWITAFVYLEGRRDALKINIEYPPIATEPVETTLLTAPITIKFDASHAKVDSQIYQILSYDWDFGDNETGTGQIVTHEYTKKGIYDAILTITKLDRTTGQELKDTHSKKISIVNQELTASFTADPDSGEAPLKVTFDAKESFDPDSKIETYEWDLNGDGKFEDEYKDKVTFEYEYGKIGSYNATLRVTSLTGKSGTSTKQIVVGVSENPEAVIEIEGTPTTFEKGVSYIFKGGSSTSPSGEIVSYEWDFGDGSPVEKTKNISHAFAKEAVYEVTLKVTDDKDNVGESISKVAIGKRPGMPEAMIMTKPAVIQGALALTGEVPFAVEFDGSNSVDTDNNIVDYEWDFNNDNQADSFGKKITHTFTEIGTYTVRLTVIDANDNYSSSTIGVQVNEQGMKAVLSATPINGEVPLTVNFDGSGSLYPNGSISSYKWDFGDGTKPILGSAKISHKYNEVGEYVATLTVIGSDNNKAEKTVNVVVRAIQVSACFETNVSKGKAPLVVTFDPGCSSGAVTSYSWNFGDGGTANEVKPSHTFESAGLYTVKLEVIDNNNTVSTKEAEIEVQP